jgi:hypothetical protein
MRSAATAIDLSPARGRWPFLLDKWYLDVLADDGAVLLVYVGRLRVGRLELRRVTADLFAPGRAPISGSAPAAPLAGGPGWLDAGAARLDGDRLAFTTAPLSGTLRFRPRAPPPPPAGPLLVAGPRRLAWRIEVPDADVDGELRTTGGVLPLRGRGYRDRVTFDLVPWRFPLRALRWGRAAAGPHACVWMEAETADRRISSRWLDGRSDPERWPVEVGEGRVVSEARVADVPGLGLGPLRPVLRRLFRDPREVKVAGPAVVLDVPGRSIREEVTWR